MRRLESRGRKRERLRKMTRDGERGKRDTVHTEKR